MVRVGGAGAIVARLPGGAAVAFSTVCPHEGTDLAGGAVLDDPVFGTTVRCPQHKYLYDPRTGANVLPTRTWPDRLWKLRPGYLPTFPVDEREGWVWVDDAPNPPPPGWDPSTEEPPAEGVDGAGAEAEADGAQAYTGADQNLVVPVGAEVTLRLAISPAAGHIWAVTVEGGRLQVVGQAFEGGDPPVCAVRLAGRQVGDDVVRCEYRRPWDTAAATVRTFPATVVG